MKLIAMDERLWGKASGKPERFFQNEGLSALAFVFQDGQRLPEEGFSAHSHPEISIVLSGEIQVGLQDGEYKVPAGTVIVIPGGEQHYTLNCSDQAARVLAFSTLP